MSKKKTAHSEDFEITDDGRGSRTLEKYLGALPSVDVPEGVTVIADRAFSPAVTVTRIKLPSTLLRIQNPYAFRHATIRVHSKNPVFYVQGGCLIERRRRGGKTVRRILCAAPDALPPRNATEICDRAFSEASLKQLFVPQSVRVIRQGAFFDCKQLEEVELFADCRIEGHAFLGCEHLRTVSVIERAVQNGGTGTERCGRIGSGAFLGCDRLEELHVPQPGIFRTLCAEYKLLAVVGYMHRYEKGKIGAEEEATYAPYIKRNRKRFVPMLLQRPAVLFYMVEKCLIDVSEIDGLIGSAKSAETKALLLEYQSKMLTPARRAMLRRCGERRVERAMLGEPKTLCEWKAEWRFRKKEDGSYKITAYIGNDTDVTVPSEICGVPVTEIAPHAFSPLGKRIDLTVAQSRNRICHVTVQAGVEIIGEDAFFGCGRLETVELPCTATSIGNGAFLQCRRLVRVACEEGLTCIGAMAFAQCNALTRVTLPRSVVEIDKTAFTKPFLGRAPFSLVIETVSGSYAEAYALEKGIPVEYLPKSK